MSKAKKATKRTKEPAFRLQLQQSKKTGLYRCQVILEDGSVYATGEPASDEFGARVRVLHAIKMKSWVSSGLKAAIDRFEAGEASDEDVLLMMG